MNKYDPLFSSTEVPAKVEASSPTSPGVTPSSAGGRKQEKEEAPLPEKVDDSGWDEGWENEDEWGQMEVI